MFCGRLKNVYVEQIYDILQSNIQYIINKILMFAI